MSRWRHGCDKEITVYVPRGYGHRAMTVRCGSTAHDGGINQCDVCARRDPMPAAYEDESDSEYVERTERDDD